MQYRNNKHEHMSYSTREKLYNNKQGFMAEVDGYKAGQHFSWSNFIKQLLLTDESIYQTHLTNAMEP
jgi:hypothetical protein